MKATLTQSKLKFIGRAMRQMLSWRLGLCPHRQVAHQMNCMQRQMGSAAVTPNGPSLEDAEQHARHTGCFATDRAKEVGTRTNHCFNRVPAWDDRVHCNH